jgi:hypothetical protein
MGHRAFTDTGGVHWQVWTVVPQWADRRTGQERRVHGSDDPDVDPPVLEQRRTPDRRRGLPDRLERVKLAGNLSGGWLTFESANERRRLSPIPPGWETAPDAELEQMCRTATATPRSIRSDEPHRRA